MATIILDVSKEWKWPKKKARNGNGSLSLSLSLSKSTVSIDKAHKQLEKRRSGDGLNFETGFVSLYQGCTLSGLLAKQADGPAHGGLSLGPSFHIPKKNKKTNKVLVW